MSYDNPWLYQGKVFETEENTFGLLEHQKERKEK